MVRTVQYVMNKENTRDDVGPVATPSSAVSEWVWIVGAEHTDRAWLLSNYDTWERNPHFLGTVPPHPENDQG